MIYNVSTKWQSSLDLIFGFGLFALELRLNNNPKSIDKMRTIGIASNSY